jgi:hypothetical protein
MQRLLIALLFVSFGATGPLTLADIKARSFLAPEESKQLLEAIDSTCDDTWCSGDLNYLFDQIACGEDACYLDVRAEIRNFDAAGEINSRDSRSYRCQLQGFESRADLVQESAQTLSYSLKLYEAVGSCLTSELAAAHPVLYLPEVKSCRSSLEQKSYFQSAAHSAYAEVFYEQPDSIQAAAQTLNDMVQAYTKTDPSCRFSYFMAFRDQANCQRINAKQVCYLPASEGQFLVLKDYVDSAAVLYFKKQKNPNPTLGKLSSQTIRVQLANNALCYTELLNLNGHQAPAQPFASSDHRSYFLSTKNLKLDTDARINATILVNSLIRKLSRNSPLACLYQEQSISLDDSACQKIGGRDVCLIAGGNTGGYFLVSKDDASGAYVSFIRFD